MMTNTSDAPLPASHEAAPPKNWFRGFLQGRTRVAAAWGFAVLLGFLARNYPTLPGIIICFLGATLRFWASGFLRKDSRPAVGGPYAHVRNPLYLGTYLMAVGTALAIENWILLGAVTLLFAVLYHYIILDEEIKLQRIFGEPYSLYCKAVPRFFMRPWPAKRATLLQINPEQAHLKHDWALSKKNKAIEAYVSFAGLIGLTALFAWLWQSFGS